MRVRRSGLALLAVFLAASMVSTAPRARGEPVHSDFADQMTRGRELAHANDLPGAEAAFRAALVIFPDDADALMELGTVLERMDRFGDSLPIFEHAAIVAEPGGPRAAAFAKVGRVHETLGETEAAIRAYRESYAERPTAEVHRHLEDLLHDTGQTLTPFTARPMWGPYSSVKEFCDGEFAQWIAAHKTLAQEDVPSGWTYDCDVDDWESAGMDEPVLQLDHPWPARIFLAHEDVPGETSLRRYWSLYLAVESGSSWYVGLVQELASSPRPMTTLRVSRMEPPHARHSGSMIFLEYDLSETDHRGYVAFAGIGPSGIPSLIVPVPVTTHPTGLPGHPLYFEWRLTPSRDIDLPCSNEGRTEVAYPSEGQAAPCPLGGQHTLVFP